MSVVPLMTRKKIHAIREGGGRRRGEMDAAPKSRVRRLGAQDDDEIFIEIYDGSEPDGLGLEEVLRGIFSTRGTCML